MAIINVGDIAGVYIKDASNFNPGWLHCIKCFEGNLKEIELDDIVTVETVQDDDIYFCDKCKKAL